MGRCENSERLLYDDRLGTASKELRASVREKLGPDKDDAANEGDFEGLGASPFALAQ